MDLFLPLYGTGALMMLIVSMPFRDNLILTYVAGCVGATVLEYITGVLMETLFKVRYWDYSIKIQLSGSNLPGIFAGMGTSDDPDDADDPQAHRKRLHSGFRLRC